MSFYLRTILLPLFLPSLLKISRSILYTLRRTLCSPESFELLNQKHQNKAEIFFKRDDIIILKELLKKGIGLSLLADIALSDEDDDLIKIPLIPKDKITFTVYYAYLKSATLVIRSRSLI